MRRILSIASFALVLGCCPIAPAAAQTPDPDDRPTQTAASADTPQAPAAWIEAQTAQAATDDEAQAAQAAPQDAQQQKPPAAIGEEGTKPTRGFFSALGHNLVDDMKHIPRRNSVYWLAGGGALALAVHPEDGTINRHLVGNSTVDTLFIPGKWIGNDGVFAAGSLGTYIVARVLNKPRVQHLGMDETEALILAEGLVEIEKEIARRPRPIGSTSSGYSFPSGHAMLTFSAATVLQEHLGYKAGIPTYLIATYVAVSRLHDNQHYASDVVFGAANGIVIGRSVTWHGRNFWGDLNVVPVPGGMALMFTRN